MINLADNDGHVTLSSFGLEELSHSQLEDLYSTTGSMRSVVTEMVTRKAYHQDRGICTHQHNDPLDLVRMHPKEDIIEGGPRRTWMRKYVNLRLGEITKCSLIEFFELPFDDAMFLVELAESKNIQESINANQLMNTLK